MDFAVTNKGKAKNLLKGTFDVNILEKGDANPCILDEKKVMKIINGDKDNAFELLNKAGNLLKDSLLTRSTGHKKNDFSSLQATSDLCVENFKRDLKGAVEAQKGVHITLDSVPDETREAILDGAKSRTSKIVEDLGKLLKDMRADPEIGAPIKKYLEETNRAEQIKMINEVMKNLQGQGMMSKHIKFTDDKNFFTGKWKGWQIGGFSALIGGAFGGPLAIGGGIVLGVGFGAAAAAAGMTASTVATGGIMLGVGLGFAALLSVPAAVLYLKRESVGAISNKRERIAFQGRYVKIIKKLNDLDKYIETEILKALKQTPADTKINPRAKEIIETISAFLKNQAEIWKNYVTAEAREYDEKNEKNKHWSLGKRVSNEKTSSMGKFKQGFARQWVKVSLAPNMLNPTN